MGVRILKGYLDKDELVERAVFYCSTTDWAFGPVMPDQDTANKFLKWLVIDPRSLTDPDLESKWYDFLNLTPEQKHQSKVCDEYDCVHCKQEE